MLYKNFAVSLFLVLIGALVACSVKAPELTVTGEKTALENQILGTYQQIEGDTYVIASTRAVGSSTAAPVSDQKKQVLDAVQNRKFNKDDIDELKQAKVVGENNQGFLEILPTERYQQDADYKSLADKLVAEENRDRQVVYERVLTVNQSAAEAGEGKVSEIFAKLNYDNSAVGTLVQMADGSWIEKK
jgi:uncharacterized protein YdbL (DUF1318 family)